MYAIRSTQGIFELKKRRKIGRKYYKYIDLSKFGPETLQNILDELPREEEEAIIRIHTAFLNKHYNKNSENIYFGPPLMIDGDEIVFINPSKTSFERLQLLFSHVIIQNPYDQEAITRLKEAIQLMQSSLPIKKRKI